MLYEQVTNELKRYQTTPQCVIRIYERIEFGQAHHNEETKLMSYFQRIFQKLNGNDDTRHELNYVATNANDLAEWYVLQSYVRGNIQGMY